MLKNDSYDRCLMIFQNSSPPTDFTTDFPWKSPIPKRSNFDRVLVWMLVAICG